MMSLSQKHWRRAHSFLQDGGWHQICTVNPEFIMEARRNPAFRAVLQASDLNTPDGFGVLVAARWQGTPLRGRVTGVELTLGAGPARRERMAIACSCSAQRRVLRKLRQSVLQIALAGAAHCRLLCRLAGTGI
ncbi:MAG: hypothetical protein KatS3mg056_0685 [Chloroflexus sp.]|nr:MAG: hypothetical protein KatS3mg056_0685 [Chloroflexus sp.]